MADPNIKFQQDVARFIDKTGVRADVVFRRIGLEVLRGVVKASPVLTGRFRGNWNVSINRVDLSTTGPDAIRGAGETVATGSATVGKSKITDAIYISNNLPYAARLEGPPPYSPKADQGIVRPTIARIRAYYASVKVVPNGGR